MRSFHAVVGAVLAVGTAACGTPTEPNQETHPPVVSAITVAELGPETVRVAWTTDQPAMGTLLIYAAEAVPVKTSQGESLSTQHVMSVAGLRPRTAYTFTVVARNTRGEVTLSTPQAFTTPDFAPGAESELQATLFHVLEYQYPDNWWHSYAPRLAVTETHGVGPAIVTEIRISVNGLMGTATYPTSKCVEAGEQNRSLLSEYFGSYELEMEFGGRPSGSASAVITYHDRAGAKATLTVTGPVIPGPPPTTSTVGTATWGCRP